jgi:2-dehydro-3-deoxyphosphogluconate aldolase/(4S)-4-hydroxy-2-oxoglutarate aldolase
LDPDSLIDGLRRQPLLVVLRADQPLQLQGRLAALAQLGLVHVEIAWTPHPAWVEQLIQLRFGNPSLKLGAASVTSLEALAAVSEAGLAYAMAPILSAELISAARQAQLLLVPGVFSPSEVQAAKEQGCRLVKLFPAASLGPDHWARLRAPLGGLPFCIAAGGLATADVEPWLAAGVDAVTLGASVAGPAGLATLAPLLERWRRRQLSVVSSPGMAPAAISPAGL